MSKKSATAQIFTINKSPLLLRFLLITHSLAAVACLTNALFWFYKLLFLIGVASSLFFYLRRYHYHFEPCQIKYYADSVWSIAYKNADFQVMQILPVSVITTWLIVLHYQLENDKQCSLVILNDALNETEYRTLAVTLKIAGLSQ